MTTLRNETGQDELRGRLVEKILSWRGPQDAGAERCDDTGWADGPGLRHPVEPRHLVVPAPRWRRRQRLTPAQGVKRRGRHHCRPFSFQPEPSLASGAFPACEAVQRVPLGWS